MAMNKGQLKQLIKIAEDLAAARASRSDRDVMIGKVLDDLHDMIEVAEQKQFDIYHAG